MLGFMPVEKNNELGLFYLYHIIITLLFSGLSFYFLPSLAFQNFMLGQLYSWISLGSLGLSLYLFFLKKSIALLIALIVLKWPILIYVVYKLTQTVTLEPLWLTIGFLPIFLSALLWSRLLKDR